MQERLSLSILIDSEVLVYELMVGRPFRKLHLLKVPQSQKDLFLVMDGKLEHIDISTVEKPNAGFCVVDLLLRVKTVVHEPLLDLIFRPVRFLRVFLDQVDLNLEIQFSPLPLKKEMLTKIPWLTCIFDKFGDNEVSRSSWAGMRGARTDLPPGKLEILGEVVFLEAFELVFVGCGLDFQGFGVFGDVSCHFGHRLGSSEVFDGFLVGALAVLSEFVIFLTFFAISWVMQLQIGFETFSGFSYRY